MLFRAKILGVTALAALLAVSASPAFAQSAPATPAAAPAPGFQTPRTSFGKPDLQGVWSNASVTGLTRPAGYPLVLSREQADALEGRSNFNVRLKTESSFVDPNTPAPEKGKPLPGVGNYDVAWTDPGSTVAHINGELRSSFIVYPENGQIPQLTEEGRRLRAAAGPGRKGTGYDHPEERGLSERCVVIGTAGPPLGQYLYNNNIRIVQSPDHMMLMAEMIHDARIVRIGGEHIDQRLQPWMGDSVGRWEGDTFVVETTNIHPDQRSGRMFLSESGKVIERFTRISDDQILYQFEVNDPVVYPEVWKAEMPLNRMAEDVHEYACHEGNYGLYNILSGGRQAERAGKDYTGGEDRGE
jgi:hypothetical protein